MFKMAVRVAYRIEGRCPRHRAYNPIKEEQGGIKGECPACYELLNAYRAYLAFREAIEKFEETAISDSDRCVVGFKWSANTVRASRCPVRGSGCPAASYPICLVLACKSISYSY